ncbi:MAG: hypothetical protein BMS9Abin26_0217 [Gammaproteobacteria bacterium]|nr:MAG: hypothetical protein BMS9Abin26_0217 [Gammaproteobacteria bacterium]
MSTNIKEIRNILKDAIDVAKRYKALTGKPLGITGEVAEFTAASLLGLVLAEARQAGYDAIQNKNGKEIKVQIKGRCLPENHKTGQRVGSIQLDKEWDTVVLVLLDHEFEPFEIYEAGRGPVTEALSAPGSKARNERGALGVSKFKSIGKKIWPTS